MKLFKYLFLIGLIAQPAILIPSIVNNTTNKNRYNLNKNKNLIEQIKDKIKTLKEQVGTLKTKINEIKDIQEEIIEQNQQLENKVKQLEAEVSSLTKQNQELDRDRASFTERLWILDTEVKQLRSSFERHQNEIELLKEENRKIKEIIVDNIGNSEFKDDIGAKGTFKNIIDKLNKRLKEKGFSDQVELKDVRPDNKPKPDTKHIDIVVKTKLITLRLDIAKVGPEKQQAKYKDQYKECIEIGYDADGRIERFKNTTNKVPEKLPRFITSLHSAFQKLESRSITNLDKGDTSNVTDMSYMFAEAKNFNQDISKGNTSNVTDMYSMFGLATFFNKDINTKEVEKQNGEKYTAGDVSKVENMEGTFNKAYAFNQPLDKGDVSNVKKMQSIFNEALAFNQDISKGNLISIDLNKKNNENGENGESLKNGADSSPLKLNKKYGPQPFLRFKLLSIFIQPILNKIQEFENLPIHHDDKKEGFTYNGFLDYIIIKLKDGPMLKEYPGLINIEKDLKLVDIKDPYDHIKNGVIKGNYNGMEIERKVTINHKQYANTVYIHNNGQIFETNKTDLSNMSQIRKIVKIGYYFDDHGAVRIVKMPTHLGEVPKDLPVEIESLTNAFKGHKTKNIHGIEKGNTSKIFNMGAVFKDAEIFDQDISSGNTSGVAVMQEMFRGAKKFNQNLNLGKVHNVENMKHMFDSALEFNQPLNGGNTQNLLFTSNMFARAKKFNQDISKGDVQRLQDMSSMFEDAETFGDGQYLPEGDNGFTKEYDYNGSGRLGNIKNARRFLYGKNKFKNNINVGTNYFEENGTDHFQFIDGKNPNDGNYCDIIVHSDGTRDQTGGRAQYLPDQVGNAIRVGRY